MHHIFNLGEAAIITKGDLHVPATVIYLSDTGQRIAVEPEGGGYLSFDYCSDGECALAALNSQGIRLIPKTQSIVITQKCYEE